MDYKFPKGESLQRSNQLRSVSVTKAACGVLQIVDQPMSALGHKRTRCSQIVMSALPPKAAPAITGWRVRHRRPFAHYGGEAGDRNMRSN